ncbi:MAG: TetR/AcrR family transcriptional regulator, partial [Thermocrispum sp.]
MNRGPGQRAGLTTAAVLAQARELLAEGGSEALSMRALARRLQVAPNAIYSHVKDKTELVDALLDDVLAAVEAPEAESVDPVDGLAAIMTSTYEVLIAHPGLVPVLLVRQGARGPNAVRLGVVMDELLARAGVDGPAAAEARRVLIVHAIGSAAFATASPDTVIPAAESHGNFARSLH